jgi:hypothetical protein
MSTILKIVIGLVLTLPIAAYVVGSLVASTAELPKQREPVNIQNVSPSQTTGPPSHSGAPGDPRPSGSTATPGDDKAGDDVDVDDNGVQIVNPEPTRVDDDADGRGDDGGGDDDDGDEDDGDDDDDDKDDGSDD